LLDSWNFSYSLLLLQNLMACGAFSAAASVERQLRSTVMKRLASVGSCFWMSSESKMGCRYSHERCTASHSSMTSDTHDSVLSHSAMRSSNGFLNDEKLMACVMVMCSSSSAISSSAPLSTDVPVSLYGRMSRFTPSHSLTILSSASSIWYSLAACSPIFSQCSACSTRPISMMVCSENESSGWMTLLILTLRSFQWRSRMPGLRSATTTGPYGRNASTSTFSFLAMSAQPCWPFLENAFSHLTSLR
jgi:hypothetical protein